VAVSEGELQLALAFEKIELRNHVWLGLVRTHAQGISRRWGKVCTDDLRHAVDEKKLPPPAHRNHWGSVFRKDVTEYGWWKRIGSKPSKRPGNHARRIGVWVWCEPDGRYIVRTKSKVNWFDSKNFDL